MNGLNPAYVESAIRKANWNLNSGQVMARIAFLSVAFPSTESHCHSWLQGGIRRASCFYFMVEDELCKNIRHQDLKNLRLQETEGVSIALKFAQRSRQSAVASLVAKGML